jgi:hypothetical protein
MKPTKPFTFETATAVGASIVGALIVFVIAYYVLG